MIRVLLVEDDFMMANAIKIALSQAGYDVEACPSAEDAERALAKSPYDLMVLDINLPGKSGLELAVLLRKKEISIPILGLTARDLPKQKVDGLDKGMDDYLVKPFDLDELLARIRALYRRSTGRSNSNIVIGNISLDPVTKLVLNKDLPLDLSAREYAILKILMDNPNKLINKHFIENKLYGWDIKIESNTIEVHISHLRKKLGDKFIRTVRGMGYIVEKIA